MIGPLAPSQGLPADSPGDWRYERKFRLENLPAHLAVQIIRAHPAGFRLAFPDRWVNNLYFDDPDLSALHDNFSGTGSRRKFRLRWYGEPFPTEPIPARWEEKIRRNQLGRKVIRVLPAVSFSTIEAILEQAEEWAPRASLYRPVLFNRYRRAYFVSAGGRIRLTIDSDLAFAEPLAALRGRRSLVPAAGAVVEIKYAPEAESEAESIMQYLPFRLSKSSKYALGLLTIAGR